MPAYYTGATGPGGSGAASGTTFSPTGTIAATDVQAAIAEAASEAAQKAANLSDLASASTARTNLGLGTAAVANVPRVVAAGNLGATPSLAMLATDMKVIQTGTLNANATFTITNLSAGQIVVFLLTQDATGGRTFSITVGGSTVAIPVNTAASAYTVVTGTYDGTDLYVKGA